MSRIFIGAQIVPGPAVESAVSHARNEVGDEIVAEIVALVGRAPEVARQRVHGEPNAVSQPTCEHSLIPARRVEHEHGRAIGLVAPRAPQTMLRLPTRDRGGTAFAHPFPVIDADPTETNIWRPSLEKTMSRVIWPRSAERPPAWERSRTITSAFPRALRSPLR